MNQNSAFSTALSTHRTVLNKYSEKLVFHYLEMLSFAMIYISMLSCLLWANFNFLLTLFCYYIWTCRKDLMALQLSKSFSYLCIVYDILYIFMEMIEWQGCEQIKKKSMQSSLHGLHNFVIVCYCFIFILRLVHFYFLNKCEKILARQQ